MIQSYLVREADLKKIPRIQNSNLDTGISLVHRSFLKNLRLIQTMGTLIETNEDTAEKFYQEFQNTYQLFTKAKKIREYMKIGNFGQGVQTQEPVMVRSRSSKDSSTERLAFFQKLKNLQPIQQETVSNSLLVLPEPLSPSLKQAVEGYIQSIDVECLRRVHLVLTSRRSLVFMTDQTHQNEDFLFDYILEKGEKIEEVRSDPQSEELIFHDAMKNQLRRRSTMQSKPVRLRKGSEGSNDSFESVKRKQVLQKSESQHPQTNSGEKHNEDHNENSIDDADSANEIKEDEVSLGLISGL